MQVQEVQVQGWVQVLVLVLVLGTATAQGTALATGWGTPASYSPIHTRSASPRTLRWRLPGGKTISC